MEKIIAGSLNIDASDDWMKFMPGCFKCLRASGDDLSVVELIKICQKGVDKVNEPNTIAKSRAEQSARMPHRKHLWCIWWKSCRTGLRFRSFSTNANQYARWWQTATHSRNTEDNMCHERTKHGKSIRQNGRD